MSARIPDEAKEVPSWRANLLRVKAKSTRQRRPRTTRSLASMSLVAVDVIALVVTAAGDHGSVRFVFGVVLGLLVPGWSIIGLMKLGNAALEFSLSVGASLALLMVAAQIMITVHVWNLSGLEIGTCLVCLPSLLLQSRGCWQSNHSR